MKGRGDFLIQSIHNDIAKSSILFSDRIQVRKLK